MKVARGCWVPFRKICSQKHVGVWFWTWTLEFLLVMLGDITSQPWNANVVTPQRFISHSEIILWPRSQECSRKERERSQGKMGLLRGSQGTWLKFLWENIKKQRCSHLCVAQIQMLEENSPLLYAHPTDSLDSNKTKGTKGKKQQKKRVQALESDRPGFKFWLYHLLHLWPWSSY